MTPLRLSPARSIVCIDPDHFKKMMPEWSAYTKSGGDAGTLCHKESGFLQEIAQEVAMRSSQNVWVDGSLRDGAWFSQVFRNIRHRFPHYKLAIFEVRFRTPPYCTAPNCKAANCAPKLWCPGCEWVPPPHISHRPSRGAPSRCRSARPKRSYESASSLVRRPQGGTCLSTSS